MKLLIVGDPHGVLPKKIPKGKFDAVLITGDLGKIDLARKIAFEDRERKKQGLPERKYTSEETKIIYNEILTSTMNVLRTYSKITPTYSLLGNVGGNAISNSATKKDEKKYKIKLPYLKKEIDKLKNFHLVRNSMRNISGLKIGFLDYFVDESWIKEFKEKDKKRVKHAEIGTEKARKILKRFGNLDILVCHQPPYGILDKVNFASAPKDWQGKHAGSKVIFEYIKKYQPKYVFCGHIHEGKGKAKIGKTMVYNVGSSGDYLVEEI